jgi:uncharacterized protein (TIGR02453 family)
MSTDGSDGMGAGTAQAGSLVAGRPGGREPGITPYFTAATFEYLRDLTANNRRDWFERNRARYIQSVRQPALAFVEAAGERLRSEISRQILADSRPVGGSLMRIHRDLRFSRDKTPYQPAIGIAFSHTECKERAAPVYYLHLGVDKVTGNKSGGGIYRADPGELNRIRDAIDRRPADWGRVAHQPDFERSHSFGQEMLQRVPKAYSADHPFADDLRRKSYSAQSKYTEEQVARHDFLDRFIENCRTEAPLMEFLAQAVGVDW